MSGVAIFKGSINFHQPKYVVKTRNLNYELQTNSWLLSLFDTVYHHQMIQFLNHFLQYNFSQDLFRAKEEAQQQINSFQSQSNWINGHLDKLDLERITIEDDGIHAVFLAEGKLHIIR